MSIDFTSQRLSYEQGELIESHLPEQPFGLLQTWVQQAIDSKQGEAYAFSLATCGYRSRDSPPPEARSRSSGGRASGAPGSRHWRGRG